MTPAELQTNIDGKVKIRDMYQKSTLQHIDKIHANQTAQLLNISGKSIKEGEIMKPDQCMTFDWGAKPAPETPLEMTEEMMTEFDRNMDAWGGVRSHG